VAAPTQTPFGSRNLPLPASAADWRVVDGKIRSRPARRSGKITFYLDFHPLLKGPDRFLTSYSGVTLETREDALILQQRIQAQRDRGKTLAEAVSAYRQPKNRRNQIRALAENWITWLEDASDLEPYTLSSYRGHVGNQFEWWGARTVDQVDWELLYQWSKWMQAEGLAPKTVVNVLATMRSFLRWYQMRHSDYVIPQFPTVKRGKRKKPVTMPLLDQAAVLSAIPDRDRGIFLAYAHLTLRQGEGRACLVDHYDFKERELWVGDALKGGGSGAVRGDTKTGECGRYPVSDELAEWLERHVPSAARFRGDVPLFPNPNTGKPYARERIQTIWREACERAGVDYIPPYRATKHSTLSELARVLTAEQLQGLARHKKFETTRGYLGEHADPKAEAQTARAQLLELKTRARNKRATRIDRKK
jgi:site-specific recombinase XerC